MSSSFCALDLNLIRSRYWCRAIPPPGTRRELGEVPEKEPHKTYQCNCWTREEERCTEFFESHTARVAHDVHALFWSGTHGLKMNVTRMTISNVCPMCETVFPNLATVRIHGVKAFRNRRCFVNRSALGRKGRRQTHLLHVLTRSALHSSTKCPFWDVYIKLEHPSKWCPSHSNARANFVEVEIPKRTSQFAERKTLGENVGINEKSFLQRPRQGSRVDKDGPTERGRRQHATHICRSPSPLLKIWHHQRGSFGLSRLCPGNATHYFSLVGIFSHI